MIKLDKARDSYQVIKKKQYDTLEKITIELNNNGIPINLSEYVIRLECFKPDNTIVVQDNNIVVKNINQLEILLDSQITVVEGEVACQIVLVKGGLMDTSFTVYLNIQPSVIKNGVESKSVITILDTFIEKVNEGTILNKNLSNNIVTGNTLNTNLASKITTGTTLNTNLANNITLANTSNTNLTAKTTTANSTNTTLNSSITNANNTKVALDKSIADGGIDKINNKIGDFRFLNTTIKTSVVDVVNELSDNTGNLNYLSTVEKKTIVGAINEINNKLYTRKRFLFTATIKTTQFTLDSSYVAGDMLEIFQTNLMIFEGDEYSISGKIVTLGSTLDIGEKVYYFINKNN
ncbi:phage baseplate upper protein [Clostridium gasigenes]|uniref:BppU family phage baseplate upper protein n=1 Tax=Clostridium gasigenes TaxID=94869 RepID=UPI001C0D9EEB|nr:BppU family phage baseplate upper protein [Clostridium gasigenes]MBU3135072.1 phage baseplate upper protein [Clostridium gasigenes]